MFCEYMQHLFLQMTGGEIAKFKEYQFDQVLIAEDHLQISLEFKVKKPNKINSHIRSAIKGNSLKMNTKRKEIPCLPRWFNKAKQPILLI